LVKSIKFSLGSLGEIQRSIVYFCITAFFRFFSPFPRMFAHTFRIFPPFFGKKPIAFFFSPQKKYATGGTGFFLKSKLRGRFVSQNIGFFCVFFLTKNSLIKSVNLLISNFLIFFPLPNRGGILCVWQFRAIRMNVILNEMKFHSGRIFHQTMFSHVFVSRIMGQCTQE